MQYLPAFTEKQQWQTIPAIDFECVQMKQISIPQRIRVYNLAKTLDLDSFFQTKNKTTPSDSEELPWKPFVKTRKKGSPLQFCDS